MKRIVLLGSTGSIGQSTLKVARDLPGKIQIVALAAGSNVDELVNQTNEFKPIAVSIASPEAASSCKVDCPMQRAFTAAQKG